MRTVKSLNIKEMTSDGLHLVMNMPLENPTNDPEKIAEIIEYLTKKMYDNDRLFMTTEHGGFVINGLKTKTIVVEPVYEIKKDKSVTIRKDF